MCSLRLVDATAKLRNVLTTMRHSQLEVVLAQYAKLDQRSGFILDPKHCSWNDINHLLAEVRIQYDSKTKKPVVGPVRQIIRKAGDNADSITPVFGLIPDDYGLSILRSALGLMFTVSNSVPSSYPRTSG